MPPLLQLLRRAVRCDPPIVERPVKSARGSASATPFRVATRGHSYFANCAWDAIAFHAMLGDNDHWAALGLTGDYWAL